MGNISLIKPLNGFISIRADTDSPVVVSEGDTIKQSDTWKYGELVLSSYTKFWTYPPREADGGPTKGNWENVDQKYIGFKCNGLLGWIKISTINALEIHEWAIQY